MKSKHVAKILVLFVFFVLFSTSIGNSVGLEQKSPLATPRMAISSAVIEGEFYIMGGITKQGKFSSVIERYDPTTDKWSKVKSMPTATAMASAVAIDKKVFILGGRNNSGISNKLQIYDTENKSWKKGKPMPLSRWYHMAVALDQKIYVMGGIAGTGGSRKALTKVDIYDPASNKWSEGLPLPTPKQGGTVAVVQGKIYVIGGRTGAGDTGRATNSVDIYDPQKNSWSSGKAMTDVRTGMQSAVVDNKIYVVGGAAKSKATNAIDVYDPSTETWSKFSSMKSPRTGHCVCASGKTIFVVGGCTKMSLAGIIGSVESITVE